MTTFIDHLYERLVGQGMLPWYETHLRHRKTMRYRAEYEARQWHSSEEILSLQWQRLTALLHHAYDTVPFYRAVFDDLGILPQDIRTTADFAHLPLLDKATIRHQGDRLISSSFNKKSLIRSATGGSTGEPLTFYYNRDSWERRIAAAMRGDSWAGWRLCAGEFYIWGAPLLPQQRFSRLKTHLHHASLRRHVINSFDLSADQTGEVVASYRRCNPRVVIGYTNAVYEFARNCRRQNLTLPAPVGVITSAERLYPHQRAMIESVFGAPVYNRYGCREVMMIGAECDQHDGLHVASDNVYIEIVQHGYLCAPEEPGEILLTDLHNYGMPMIRYKVGDIGSWKAGLCVCGRGLPLINVVEGRTLDLIRIQNGGTVSGEFFPHLLKDFGAIRTYQVIQESMDLLRIRIALDRPLAASEQRLLQKTVADRLGPQMQIDWEIGENVQIERTRKFRPVISHVADNLAS